MGINPQQRLLVVTRRTLSKSVIPLAVTDYEMESRLGCRLSGVDFDDHYVGYGSLRVVPALAGRAYFSMGFLLRVRRSTSDFDKSCPKYISSAKRSTSDREGMVPIAVDNSIRLLSMSLRSVSDILKLIWFRSMWCSFHTILPT